MSSRNETISAGRLRRLEDFILVLRSHLPEIKERYHVSSLEIFGSYVRGEQDQDSDLDILVEYEKVPGMFKYIELENHLGDLLGVKVDLVMKKALKPAIGKQILAEAVPV